MTHATPSPRRSAPYGGVASDRQANKAGQPSNVRLLSHDEFLELRGIIDQWAAERIQAEPVRYLNWPKVIEAFCLAVAVGSIFYFAAEFLLRAVLP